MNRLGTLRTQLQSLRFARWGVRALSAAALLITIVVWSWLSLGWLDWSVNWGIGWRAAILVGWLAAIAVLVYRRFWSQFTFTESLEEVALQVEKTHSIDSDLVAALQFDSSLQPIWGSPRLSSAVVDYVAEYSQGLNVYHKFDWSTLPRRAALAATTLLIASIVIIFWPGHASAFWNRFWLGADRYPTKTRIVELKINGQSVPVFHHGTAKLSLAQERPLAVQVRLRGRTDVKVVAHVVGIPSRERTVWEFRRMDGTHASESTDFEYEVPHLLESSRLILRAGDTEADAIEIELLSLPIVDVAWTVAPPAYAKNSAIAGVSAGARQFAALQGSRLSLEVQGINKPLKEVIFVSGGERLPMEVQPDSHGLHWRLSGHWTAQPLREALQYEIEVTDGDGLSPNPPISGEIRLQADRLPRIAAAIISQHVLPTAVPKVTYGATDDFGLKSIGMKLEIVRRQGQASVQELRLWSNEKKFGEKSIRGSHDIELSSLKLQKGDEVRLTLTAADERGEFPSGESQSEPLVFEVTDRNGILESLLEIDQQSAKHLDEIIERELGIGRTSR